MNSVVLLARLPILNVSLVLVMSCYGHLFRLNCPSLLVSQKRLFVFDCPCYAPSFSEIKG